MFHICQQKQYVSGPSLTICMLEGMGSHVNWCWSKDGVISVYGTVAETTTTCPFFVSSLKSGETN